MYFQKTGCVHARRRCAGANSQDLESVLQILGVGECPCTAFERRGPLDVFGREENTKQGLFHVGSLEM